MRMLYRRTPLLGVALAAGIVGVPAATWADVQDGQFHYYSIVTRVSDLVATIAADMGVPVEIEGDLDRTVRSRHFMGEPSQILDDLALQFGFDYFDFNGVLYVSTRDQRVTRLIAREGIPQEDVVGMIEQIGLDQDRLRYSSDPRSEAVTVTGPPAAIGMVEAMLMAAGPSEVRARQSIVVRRGNTIAYETPSIRQ